MFSLFEISNFLGRPVCLYDFMWGNTAYRYTSADRAIQYPYVDGDPENGNWYQPIAISDNGFTQGTDAQDFVVTLPRNNPLVDLFRSTSPSTKIVMTCRRFHKDDPDNQATVYWTGTVGNVRGTDAVTAEVLGLPITKTLRRTGLRACWEVGCIHALYDGGCKADKELFKTVATITALTGTTVTLDTLGAFPGDNYIGGYLEWEATDEGTIDRRAIEGYAGGTTLTILTTTDRLVVGQGVSIFLGCNLTTETCKNRFDNLENYGGFPFMAKKSPFDGNPVF